MRRPKQGWSARSGWFRGRRLAPSHARGHGWTPPQSSDHD